MASGDPVISEMLHLNTFTIYCRCRLALTTPRLSVRLSSILLPYLGQGSVFRCIVALFNLEQVRATISERGPDETFRSSSWAGVTNENTKMRMYIYITILLLQSRQISETAGAACHEEVFQCPA